MLSLVVPIYKNEANIPPLLEALASIHEAVGGDFEAVFVVDGSPDASYLVLKESLPKQRFPARLLGLSRNFGAFAAIRAGLEEAKGDYFAVMAADLQEPPSLVLDMHAALSAGECEVAIGERVGRDDPFFSRLLSSAFWWTYRRLIVRDIPMGGVDVFGCTKKVRDELVSLRESHSSLIGLLFWVGFKRKLIPYKRAKREVGVSAWSFAKKLRYMNDSIFSFSSIPIELLLRLGGLGLFISITFSCVVLVSAVTGQIQVPGYAATILTIIFFGTLNLLSTGVLGIYVWRTFENTKSRPPHIVGEVEHFSGQGDAHV